MTSAREDYDRLSDLLDVALPGSPEFASALTAMEALAEAGSIEAAEAVAEIFAFTEKHRQPERAYHWYYIALAAQGYATGFDDQNNSPPHYCGPIGDFRNEAQVNLLIAELGFARVRLLDKLAEECLQKLRGA